MQRVVLHISMQLRTAFACFLRKQIAARACPLHKFDKGGAGDLMGRKKAAEEGTLHDGGQREQRYSSTQCSLAIEAEGKMWCYATVLGIYWTFDPLRKGKDESCPFAQMTISPKSFFSLFTASHHFSPGRSTGPRTTTSPRRSALLC